MSLKVLMLEEEPELEISHVPLANTHEPVADPEMPTEMLVIPEQEIVDIDDVVASLESACLRIGNEGMDLASARAIDKALPGFLRRNGGANAFTATPSLEGLVEGAKGVGEAVKAAFARVCKFVADMFRRFKQWLVTRFSKADAVDATPEVNAFVAERRNLEAIKFLSALPDELDEAAAEVARFVDGDTKEFALALADQLQSLGTRVESIEKKMEEEPTHFRLARGDITVKELFKADAESGILELLKRASTAADNALKARNGDEFIKAMEVVSAVAAEVKQFRENFVVNDQASADHGDKRAVSFDKLFENVQTAINDMKSVDVQKYVKDLTGVVDQIVNLADAGGNRNESFDEVLEMIPEGDEKQRYHHAMNITALYRDISRLGNSLLDLWRVRANAVTSINAVGTALIGLVDAFEKGVASAAGSLTPEQKTQLTKALAGKGLKVEF